MNIAGLKAAAKKLLDNVQEMIEAKEEAIGNTENEDRIEKLEAQLAILEAFHAAMEEETDNLDEWES
jgi:hypothetical protein